MVGEVFVKCDGVGESEVARLCSFSVFPFSAIAIQVLPALHCPSPPKAQSLLKSLIRVWPAWTLKYRVTFFIIPRFTQKARLESPSPIQVEEENKRELRRKASRWR